MKHRWFICAVVLAVLTAFAIWLEPTRVVWGWLRGEPFYRGRPASYWSGEIATWRHYPLGMAWVRPPNTMERWLARLLSRPARTVVIPDMFHDEQAVPVLQELIRDADPRVRRNAQMALTAIVPPPNEP